MHRRSSLRPDYSRAKIPKALPGSSLPDKSRHPRPQVIDEIFPFYRILINAVQPGAGLVATKVKLILARPFSYQRDFSHVWPRATIRTAGHPHDEFFILQSELCLKLLELC